MIGKKLISIKPVSLAAVKDVLKQRSESSEPTYEQNLTSDYVKKFAKLPLAKAVKLLEELKGIEALRDSEEVVVKIVDILPEDLDRLRLILPKGFKAKDEELQKIIETVKSFQK